MKGKLKYIPVILFVALIGAFIIWRYAFRESGMNVSSEKPDYTLTSSGLLQSFETDENAANALYLDKILLVSGTVESVSSDSLGISVYLKEGDAIAGVICSFEKESIDTALIRKGIRVNIKGICTGYLMDVVLNRCSLETGAK
jgi:hypothetical protein